jgi:LPXTG-motif cell wall-anchored protein
VGSGFKSLGVHRVLIAQTEVGRPPYNYASASYELPVGTLRAPRRVPTGLTHSCVNHHVVSTLTVGKVAGFPASPHDIIESDDMRSHVIFSSLIGVGLLAASTLVTTPAFAVTPLTYDVNCDGSHTTDVTEDIPVFVGQDVVFTFTPATCKEVFWSWMNPALTDVTGGALVGTSTVTIPYADIIFGNEFELNHETTSNGDTIYFLTFTDGGPAPAPAEAGATPLPNTGFDASALTLGALGLLSAGAITTVVIRRRSV